MAQTRGADSIGQNVRGLLTQAERLARTEMELALSKGRDKVGDQVRHLAMLAGAAVFALGGMAFLLHAIYQGLETQLDSWLAALLTALIAFACAGVFVKVAAGRDSTEPARDRLKSGRDRLEAGDAVTAR